MRYCVQNQQVACSSICRTVLRDRPVRCGVDAGPDEQRSVGDGEALATAVGALMAAVDDFDLTTFPVE